MVQRRPRILFISDCWPHGKAFGGQLRALHTARALAKMGSLSFLVVNTDEADPQEILDSRAEFDIQSPICPALSPNRSLIEKLRWSFDPRYLNVHGCTASPADRSRITLAFQGFDLVWVLNARTPNVLGIRGWPHSHLDLSDVPSTYSRTVAERGAHQVQRWRARMQQFFSKQRELVFKTRFTTISVCSAQDREYLGGDERIHVIPNGFEQPRAEPARNATFDPPRIGFIGLYSYAPNVDGVRWFLKESWPAIRQANPGVKFRLVGKQTDGPLKPVEPDVEALGYLADPAAEIATWSAMVIPIRFGGGTRVKIADAFSRKCPVVATSLGAFGYDVQDGKQLRIADTPEGFSRACNDLLTNPAEGRDMAERAWKDFLEHWTWDAIATKVRFAAEDCLGRSSPAVR
jgi:glycosyltransferase involved in cell wall biosynthesis